MGARLGWQTEGVAGTQFRELYPELVVELVCTTAPVHPVADGFDLVVTPHRPTSEDLLSSTLLRSQWRCAASPAWLQSLGRPVTLDDLREGPTISLIEWGLPEDRWPWRGDWLPIRPVARSNDLRLVLQAASLGVGPVLVPAFAGPRRAGLQLLPELEVGGECTLWLMSATPSSQSVRIRSLLEFLRSVIAAPGRFLP